MTVKRLPIGRPILIALVLILAAGCSQGSTPVNSQTAPGETSESTSLSVDDQNVLGVRDQLALGTLNLEETPNAVTEDQATTLLLLWQALQDNSLQSDEETAAVLKQIQTTMTEAQLSAIRAMALTDDDAQTWAENAGPAGRAGEGNAPGGAAPGGAARPSQEDRAAMREKFQNLSEEERAALREQMGGGTNGGGLQGGAVTAGSTQQLTMAVVRLLTARSGQEPTMGPPQDNPPNQPGTGDAGDLPTQTEEEETEVRKDEGAETAPTAGPEPTATATPQPASQSEARPPEDVEAATSADPTGERQEPAVVTDAGGTAGATAVTDAAPADPDPVQTIANTASATPAPALTQVVDTNPGPPFSVAISLNRAEPSTLLEGATVYKVTGLLRNDGDEVYAVNTVNFTFYDADGFRGAFYRFPNRRYGEWIEHGAMEADFDCMLLAPGEACPFEAEIAAYQMGSFYVHADAVVAEWREPAPVKVASSHSVDQGSNVKITATIQNPNPYPIKNVVLCGALVDSNGQITSIGSATSIQSVAPDASVTLNVMAPSDTYTSYQLFVQAEGDVK